MREIEKMDEDLQLALAAHAKVASEVIKRVADQMAEAARSKSSPLYGISVDAKVTSTLNKSTVDVSIQPTRGGIGKVYGGVPAVEKQVAKDMGAVARGAGLD